MTVEAKFTVVILLKKSDCDILGGKNSHVEAEVCKGADECTPKIQMFRYFDIILSAIANQLVA